MLIDNTEIYLKKISGKGDLNFFLIHNAGSDHRFFTHQVSILKEFGDVILMDMPGSGGSGLVTDYSMKGLSQLVKKICLKMGLKNICLMGLNNGSNIAIETAIHQNLDVQKLILIDPPIFMESSFIEEIESFIELIKDNKFDSTFVHSIVEDLFLNAPQDAKDIAFSAFNQVDKGALQAIFQGLIEWDKKSKGILKKIDCPTLCILTDEHHCTFEKMKKEAPHFELGKVIGSKCWATLEVPEQVNAMIKRFLNL